MLLNFISIVVVIGFLLRFLYFVKFMNQSYAQVCNYETCVVLQKQKKGIECKTTKIDMATVAVRLAHTLERIATYSVLALAMFFTSFIKVFRHSQQQAAGVNGHQHTLLQLVPQMKDRYRGN